jgi:hypothetical protein
MATPKPFPHASFLRDLEHFGASISPATGTPLPPGLARILGTTEAGPSTLVVVALVELLKARKAVLRASFDAELVADALRRYQKFAKPGQPSAHIVQLRQQQAAARQAGSQARQAFIKAAWPSCGPQVSMCRRGWRWSGLSSTGWTPMCRRGRCLAMR